MQERYPDLMKAYESLGEACAAAGPLNGRTVALVKLSISLAAGLDGAARSHARKALEAGCAPEELEHVALLLTPTVGFPAMMRARGAIREVIETGERRQ
jgi:alkylhydroperoxidase/carboxymuconolactone decarboxylase family protein YurZ